MSAGPPRRGLSAWLVPILLGALALVLFVIVVAVLAAAVGLWPSA